MAITDWIQTGAVIYFEEQPLCGNNRCCVEMDSRFRCNAIWKSESHCTTTWPVIFGWTEQK